ncbi:hypothetical protein CPLU01_09820 [Colletotrichum plurivorum]|uniref:Uncharacterized protein n=1 Tax=Colletotrichum plurivorum TaxID=2175906 RepID=A0A8H6NAA3_9PEZI|nr:hypothetical protein CPLU01_09820 [Colletotrichum plurivorum]
MASQQGQEYDRGFREVVLGRCFVQTASERFGDGAPEIIRQREHDHLSDVEAEPLFQGVPVGQIVTGTEQDEPDGQDPPLERRIPKMPYFRNNLTALSQRYNVGASLRSGLYFAAYENRIFVYQPQSVQKQSLPREPSLILATKPDKVATHISGTLDSRFHHQANHITTGFLGREEILVSAYDDGSVFAWYIRHIAEYVERMSSGCNKAPVPSYFFTENVGKSAWGLAVHQKSRLIAVSSNRFEVTVFAFGLSRLPEAMDRTRPLDYCERSVLKRRRNWRIVMPLGEGGHNIPNVSFWENEEGFAEKVAAIDIRGVVWILNIWKAKTAAIKIPHRANVPDHWHWDFRHPMGWGVVVLPRESFLPAHSASDLLGLEESDIMNAKAPHVGRWIEVQRGLAGVRGHPAEPSAHRMPEPETFVSQHTAPGWAMMVANIPPAFLPIAQQHVTLGATAAANLIINSINNDEGEENENNENNPPGVAAVAVAAQPSMPNNPATSLNEGDAVGSVDNESSDGELFVTQAEGGGAAGAIVDALSDSSDEDENDENEAIESNDEETSSVELPDLGLMPDEDNDFVFIEEAVSAAGNDPATGTGMMQVLPPEGTCSGSSQSSWLDMVYHPHEGETSVTATSVVGRLQFHRRERIKNRNTQGQGPEVLEEISSRCCILRTFEDDIEMCSINYDDGAAVFCRDPIRFNHPSNPFMQHSKRLNMVLHVPELSLVVIGSAMGRVILLTPTRAPHGVEGYRFTVKHGYRIDWVLPTRTDEKAGRRPPRGLYGIAVGPVQESGAPGCLLRSDSAPAPSPASRRYRLMLHYRDHRILTYEIGRDEKQEHLLIF